MEVKVQDAQKVRKVYREDPIKFFCDVLDVNPDFVWDKMIDVAWSVRDNEYTAVKAGHSVSKTYTAARLALWYLFCFRPSTVITTAPTAKQVEDILWREIREAHGNAKFPIPLGGYVTKTGIDLQQGLGRKGDAEKWFAVGFATRPDTVTKQATAFQGYHNKHVLIIFDEAAGIPKEIWEAADTLMADEGGNCRFLAIGNPTSCKGEFPKCFKDARFEKITISVMDTPNYKLGNADIPGVSGRKFVEMIERKYGRGSNYFKARVLGEIPDEDIDSIITVAMLDTARDKAFVGRDLPRRFIAGDPADGGDESVFYYMEETDIKDELIFQKKGITQTAGKVNSFMAKHNVDWYAGDCIGVGKGVSDLLAEWGHHVIYAVDSRLKQKSGVPEIYHNRRAEMWITAGEDFNEEEIQLTWADEVLREQLATVTQLVRNGRILIQPKDLIKKELGRSPDRADAYILGLFARRFVPLESEDDYPTQTDIASSYTVNSSFGGRR
jgi:hypothetical protein